MKDISLNHTYANRQILLLGGLGFLGKVLFVMFLKKLPEIKQIYLVIRPSSPNTAQERFLKSLLTSPVFQSLREELKEHFLEFVNARVTVIKGDVSQPNFGIESQNILTELQNNIDLVINSAGLVAFNPDVVDAFRANVQGTIHAADFVKQSRKSSLLHVSTCYVAGNVCGVIPEEFKGNITPSGVPFNGIEEIELIKQWIKNTTDSNVLNQRVADRIKVFGWPNIYTYTKALAEAWIENQKAMIRFSIIRPSILESTLKFPFPGWNEGFNTTAPLVKFAKSGRRFFVGKKDLPLDVLPIDICCAQLIKIGALLILGKGAPVYQCGTSSKNPLSMQKACSLMGQRYVKNVSFISKILFPHKIQTVDLRHPLSCFIQHALLSKIPKQFIRKSRFLRKTIKMTSAFCKVTEMLLPFTYHNTYIFETDLLDKIKVTDPGWETDCNQIDWDDYWTNIHLPGLEKWCFSKIGQYS